MNSILNSIDIIRLSFYKTPVIIWKEISKIKKNCGVALTKQERFTEFVGNKFEKSKFKGA